MALEMVVDRGYLLFLEDEYVGYRELYREMEEPALFLYTCFESWASRRCRLCIVSVTGGLGSLFQYSIPYEPGLVGFLPEPEDMGYCSL